jgi:hypothetical protein
MSTFRERKAMRADYFHRFINGWKECACSACMGSGRYDHDGAPACGACDGSGRERFAPKSPPLPNHRPRSMGETSSEQRQFDIDYFSQPGIHIPKYREDLDYLRPLVAAERERIAMERAAAWAARRAPGVGL